MDPVDDLALAEAMSNAEAAGRVAILGIVAICNELAHLGAVDASAVTRIKEYMLIGAERSGATEKMANSMTALIDDQFLDLIWRMQAGLGDVGAKH